MTERLPAPVRRMLLGIGLSSFGTGLTLPFGVILLHEVRAFPLPVTGMLLAIPGLVGLLATPLSGVLIDRYGAAAVLRVTLVLQAVASGSLVHARSVPLAAAALVVLGGGLGPSFPAAGALLNDLVHGPDTMARAFGVQFTVINGGIGLASLVGAVVVDVHRPGTFVLLYTGNALLTLCSVLLVPPGAPRAATPAHEHEDAPSYRELLADPAFRVLCLVSLLLALCGYAALDSGVPAFARVVAGISPRVVALTFTVNTAVIVLGQLLMLRLLRGRRRTTALAATAVLWGASWGVLGLAGVLPDGGWRNACALVFAAVFAVGETFMAPTLNPLVNALATDRLRGRYNAMSGASFGVAFVAAPAISGALIGTGFGAAWVVLLVAGCAATVLATRALRRRLTPAQDGLAVPAQVQAAGV